jgi:hypothetical protein
MLNTGNQLVISGVMETPSPTQTKRCPITCSPVQFLDVVEHVPDVTRAWFRYVRKKPHFRWGFLNA